MSGERSIMRKEEGKKMKYEEARKKPRML